MKIRSRVVEKEAVRWTGANTDEVLRFVGEGKAWKATGGLAVKSMEGVIVAAKGDYIIKGVQGEFYPCKPEVFDKTYDIIPEAK